MHYERKRTTGTPGEPATRLPLKVAGTPAERFWVKVDTSGDCWLWAGGKTGGGYGYLWVAGTMVRAHRFSYELANGPIPPGQHLDHLCGTRACVRPSHLEPVTQAENNRRAARVRVA